jgi:four helix bundle protein
MAAVELASVDAVILHYGGNTSQDPFPAQRRACDQWPRLAQSIPLNIAERNGKQSLKGKTRFVEIARGSA